MNKHKRQSKRRSQTKRRYKRRVTKKMRGGALSESEIIQLKNIGFSDYQIETLQAFDVTVDYVMNKINAIQGENGFSGNSDDLVDHIMDQIYNEQMDQGNNEQMDQGNNEQDNLSIAEGSQNTDGTMDIDELNVSQNSMEGYTSDENDMSQTLGGKRNATSIMLCIFKKTIRKMC